MSLSQTSVAMATIVSQTLAAKGLELKPVNETPLQELVELSTTQVKLNDSMVVGNGVLEPQDFTAALLAGANDAPQEGQESDHSIRMRESASLLARVLNNTLDLAQNTVTPMIQRVFDKIGETIDSKLQAAGCPLELVQQRPDPIFNSVYLVESVARYKQQPRQVPLRSLGLEIGDVNARLTTGHQGMDEQLAGFVERHGQDFVTSVWNQLFNSAPASSMDVFGRTSQADEAVLAYFYAAKALQEVPAGLDLELSAWRQYCSSLLAAAGATICAYLDERVLAQKFGQLVLAWPSEPEPLGKIVVDGDKYQNWLAQGGAPELIFATAYGDRKFDPQTMLDRAEKLRVEWDRTMSLYTTTINYKRFDALVEGLRGALSTEINALPENQLSSTREIAHTRLREIAHAAKLGDLQNLWAFVRHAVCATLFSQTDIESLLLAIDEQGKSRPETPTRELALYATIEIVAKWLFDQLTVDTHRTR